MWRYITNTQGTLHASKLCAPSGVFFYLPKTARKYDYKYMRIIDDTLYAELVRILAEDAKVKAFQRLILAPTAEPTAQPDEIKTNEVKENGIQ